MGFPEGLTMLRVLMPRFYVLVSSLTAGAVFLTFKATTRHDTVAAVGWLVASILGVVMLIAPIIMHTLMRRVRPPSRRGRHAQR
jgi:hypothetical protein